MEMSVELEAKLHLVALEAELLVEPQSELWLF